MQFVKIRPSDYEDVVGVGEDFEVEFVGMSVTRSDSAGDNELLLFSLHEDEEAMAARSCAEQTSERKNGEFEGTIPMNGDADSSTSNAQTIELRESKWKQLSEYEFARMTNGYNSEFLKNRGSSVDFPRSFKISRTDITLIHYDPSLDGHDMGKKPDAFLAVPGSKRLYYQHRGKNAECHLNHSEVALLQVRFTVLQLDRLSDDQMTAIQNIDNVARSMQNSAASVPYLKIISGALRVANWAGRAAMRRVLNADQVMSSDVIFRISKRDKRKCTQDQKKEEYGNFLRVRFNNRGFPRLSVCKVPLTFLCLCKCSVWILFFFESKS